MQDGKIVAVHSCPSVTSTLLCEIYRWRESGASEDDVIERLRTRCVPSGYTTLLWSSGKNNL